ncbi:hypothetical protein ACTP13_13415 [Paenibacillus peoriae]
MTNEKGAPVGIGVPFFGMFIILTAPYVSYETLEVACVTSQYQISIIYIKFIGNVAEYNTERTEDNLSFYPIVCLK